MSEQKLLNLYNFDRPALGDLLAGWGYSDYYADRLWRYLYQPPYPAIADMHDLRPDLRARLASRCELQQPRCVLAQESKDGTRKYLLSLADGEQIETVLMPYRDRYTVCISTQAGCAMGCVFCATGQMGFRRNLTAGEIVAQVLFAANVAQEDAPQRRLRNVVMMGMGEPMHNYDETTRAIRILTEDTGMAIGPRHPEHRGPRPGNQAAGAREFGRQPRRQSSRRHGRAAKRPCTSGTSLVPRRRRERLPRLLQRDESPHLLRVDVN